jgi:surfactin synthase thioesterase subunit
VNQKRSPWLDFPSLRANSALRLFCFPYAGGSGSIFRDWQSALPAGVDVCAVQLPGRGSRLRDPMIKRLDAVVKVLMQELRPFMDRPFAFFGHSMGAMIAFELARSLRNELRRQPVHLFISGRRPPDVPAEQELEYNLPDADLMARLRDLDGTPRELLESPEAMELMLPVVRADFEVVQTYKYVPQPPLQVAMDILAGSEDVQTSPQLMEGWKRQTTGRFSSRVLPGGHFFVLHARTQLLDLLATSLDGVLHRIQTRSMVAVK